MTDKLLSHHGNLREHVDTIVGDISFGMAEGDFHLPSLLFAADVEELVVFGVEGQRL